MPYLIRHYSTFADKLIFYDGGSTDGTREIIEACPIAELRGWEWWDALDDNVFLMLSNTAWHEARGKADWIIWIDADEFLYHENIRDILATYQADGVTVPHIDGHTMVSDGPPTGSGQIYDEIRTGFPDLDWGKSALFQPCVDMRFNPGRHSFNEEVAQAKRSLRADIKLLHYRALGMDYLRARHARNWARVPSHCRDSNYGVNCEPGHEGHHGVIWFEAMLRRKWPEVIP